MLRLVFDTETNGLLPELTRLHCLTIQDPDTGQEWSYADQPGYTPIAEGLDFLSTADVLIGHNIIGFDLKAIAKVYPTWKPKHGVKLIDTQVTCQTIWPSLYDLDAGLVAAKTLEPKYMKRHSLRAWGQRLGVMKDDYEGGWDEWSEIMHTYGEQDTRVTTALLHFIEERRFSEDAIRLEHEVVTILIQQEIDGFPFNMDKAVALQGRLAEERMSLEDQLIETFGSWEVKSFTISARTFHRAIPNTWVTLPRTGKNGQKLKDYVGPEKELIEKGQKMWRSKTITFSPGSRDHIAKVMRERYGWKPVDFTKEGKPVVDEDTLAGLSHIPEAALLIRYLTLTKREGALANGNGAWMKLARKDAKGRWRIHGRVKHMGTPTSRCAHVSPNVTAVPKVGNAFGQECRELFEAEEGMVLVGVDATSAQLRWLAHYLGAWDGGAYRDVLLNSDPHLFTADIFDFRKPDGELDKARGKTMNYAYLFGAFDKKLGSIIDPAAKATLQKKLGADARKKMETRIEGLANLVEALAAKLKSTRKFRNGKMVAASQHILGLDGRKIPIKSDYTVLNYLLMSAEAVAMKWAMVRFHKLAKEAGYVSGIHYVQHSFNHDELQVSALPAIAEEVGALIVLAIQQSGEHFKSRCPIDGNYCLGKNWADTH